MRALFFMGFILLEFVSISFGEELRDVKSPVAFPPNYVLWLLMAGLLLIAVIVFFVLPLLKKPKPKRVEPQDTRLPWQIAFDELAALQKQDLLTQKQFKE